MELPGFADQKDLLQWADSRAAQADLPRLIRRLILETGSGVVSLGVPAGEGVGTGGWDGVARATGATEHVPKGLSVWELSVHKSPGVKADGDYGKRTASPDGSPTTDCTYVQVSGRRWKDRESWAKDRSDEKRWAEVRAYGVDDLEAWLETAPVTWAWISEKLGLHPSGMRSAEYWWDAWSANTTPTTPADLVLAGRTPQAQALRERLEGPGQTTTISASSSEEVLAFIAAVGIEQDVTGTSPLLAQMAFVDDLQAWRRLIAHTKPLILVPRADGLAGEVPAGCVHHVVVPVPEAAAPDITLPDIDANQAATALEATGQVPHDRAVELGHLARRSFTALRRALANKPDLHRPPWAASPVGRVTRGVLLAGSWKGDRDGDREIVSNLTGLAAGDLLDGVRPLARSDDPLVSRTGAAWSVVSIYDAWLLLARELQDDDLDRLEQAVLTVLGERDPALDLPQHDRWRAAISGHVRKFSGTLRRGLAKTLALLGTHGDIVTTSKGHTGANIAEYLVRQLLDAANTDATGETWTSLSDVLPLLAEAGPDSFIDAVRKGVSGVDPALAKMFTDTKDDHSIFSGSSPHTGLLWALENLAWSPEHFGAAIDLLARLDAIDPGGRLSNRPFASIEKIFTPWFPETAVSIEGRLAVVDGLRDRHPDVAWRLLMTMLPDFHGAHFHTHEPQFRDWKPPTRNVTNVEYFEIVSGVVDRAVHDAGNDPARWSELLKEGTQLAPEQRRRLVTTLTEKVDAGAFDGIDTAKLWTDIRDMVGRHREFSETDWALPAEELTAMNELATRIQPPEGSVASVLWLFQDHMPDLGDESVSRRDHGAYQARIAELRTRAVDTVHRSGGLDAVLQLAEQSVVAWTVGVGLADIASDTYVEDLLPDLERDDSGARGAVAHAYFARRSEQAGWDWLGQLLERDDLSDRQKARLLLAMHDLPRTWETAAELGPNVKHEFWSAFRYVGLGHDFPHVVLVATNLVTAGRLVGALDFLTLYGRHQGVDEAVVAEILADALEQMLRVDDPQAVHLREHDFEEVFEILERQADTVGLERVATLQWAYLPALGYHPDAPTLQRFMAEDPKFFAQIVSTVYRPQSDDDNEDDDTEVEDEAEHVDEQREARATNGYRLLSSWNSVPGYRADGTFDEDEFNAWIDAAIVELREAKRYAVGLTHIGRMLVAAPADPDGGWPPTAVRRLFERLQDDDVEDGYFVEVLGRRGVTSRGLEDGGEQERALVDRYRADVERSANQWPRTAAILRKIVKSYESEARRNDESAERFRRGLER